MSVSTVIGVSSPCPQVLTVCSISSDLDSHPGGYRLLPHNHLQKGVSDAPKTGNPPYPKAAEARHFRSLRRSLSEPSWVGAASQTALLFPRVAERAQNDRHRSKREQDAPIPRRDTRHQQRERRGKDPVQGSCPYVVAEAHPAEKTGRVVGGQKRGALPRRDHAHERGDPAIPARHPDDRGDHAREGDQVDPTVHLWGQDPWKAHSCVFSLRRFFTLSTASHRPDSPRSWAYCARSAEELCGV